MCSTCDHTKYITYSVEKFGHTENRLKTENEHLDINCNCSGKDFKIGDFTIYRCPTCGRKLY